MFLRWVAALRGLSPIHTVPAASIIAVVAFVVGAVVLLGVAERAYVGAVLGRHRGRSVMAARTPRAIAMRMTWRLSVAAYLGLFLFVALGKRAILDQLYPETEVVLYAMLSVPLIIAFLIYTNRPD